WLRRLLTYVEPAPARLSVHRAELWLALCLTAFFVVAGGLTLRAGLIGLAMAAIWAAFISDDTPRHASSLDTRASSPTHDRLWRITIDAVPEPTVVLDGSGQIVHANRLADELFGTRKRGGHITSMTRDPALLDAVDDVLAMREAREVEVHTRVPVERRLLV